METRAHPGEPPLYETIFLLDDSGRLAAEEVRAGGRATMRVRYRRDAAGRVIEKCAFDVRETETPNGCARLKYRKDAKRPFESDDISSDGSTAAHYVYIYGHDGRETERRLSRTGAKKPVVHRRTYDPDGRLKCTQIFDPLFGNTVIHYRYTTTGERSEEVLEPGGLIRTYTMPCSEWLLIEAS
jgi:hypothetical protein